MPIPKRRHVFLIGGYVLAILLLIDSIYLLKHQPKPSFGFKHRSFSPDSVLGWKQTADYGFNKDVEDMAGECYSVNFNSYHDGFRYYPARRDNSRPILLILGDSFTQALDVSDDKTYYSYLEDSLNCQIYAYGMGGYGTLQEYMILDQYLETINPDMVLLQFCSNDYLDNHLQLLKKARYDVGAWRPYLNTDFDLFYSTTQTFQEIFTDHTIFSHFLALQYRRLEKKIKGKPKFAERQIADLGQNYQPYKESVLITDHIFEMFKKRLGDIPLIILSADHYNPQEKDLKAIAKKHQIPIIPFPLKKMQPGGKKAHTYAGDQWHWNERGHQIISEEIIQFLKETPSLTN